MEFDIIDNTVDDEGNKKLYQYLWKSPKKFLLLPITRLWQIYQKKCEEENTERVCYSIFLKLRTFDLCDPSESDRQHCVCKYHFNWSELQNSVEKTLGCQISSPDELRKVMWQNKDAGFDALVFKRMINVVVGEDKNGKEKKKWKTKTVKMSWREAYDIVSEDLVQFEDHDKAWKADCQHYTAWEEEQLKNGAVVVHADFSNNINCDSKDECQQSFFGKDTLCLHVCVVKFKFGDTVEEIAPTKKQYVFHGGDFKDHSNELATKALHDVLMMLKAKFPAVKISHLVFRSDNCASQYKSFYTVMNYIWLVKFHKLRLSKIWCVAEHGKGEVDAAGGRSCKCRLRRPIQTGKLDVDCTATWMNYLKDQDQKLPPKIPRSYIEVSPDQHETMKNYGLKVRALRKDKELEDLEGHYITQWHWAELDHDDIDEKTSSAKIFYKTIFNPDVGFWDAKITFPSDILKVKHFD